MAYNRRYLSILIIALLVQHVTLDVTCTAGTFSEGSKGFVRCEFGQDVRQGTHQFSVVYCGAGICGSTKTYALVCEIDDGKQECKDDYVPGYNFDGQVDSSLTLVITNLTEQTAGVYQCVIPDVDSPEHTCSLTLTGSPVTPMSDVITTRNPENQVHAESDRTADVQGFPSLVVTLVVLAVVLFAVCGLLIGFIRYKNSRRQTVAENQDENETRSECFATCERFAVNCKLLPPSLPSTEPPPPTVDTGVGDHIVTMDCGNQNRVSDPRNVVTFKTNSSSDADPLLSRNTSTGDRPDSGTPLVNGSPRQHALSNSNEFSDHNCPVCHKPPTNPRTLNNCGHTFCTDCLEGFLKDKAACPVCKKPVSGATAGSRGGTLTHKVQFGDQPLDGTMSMHFSDKQLSGPAFYIITYQFPAGTQGDAHPHAGRPYEAYLKTAYLPDTFEGRTVLMMLKTAFDRRLVFTIGSVSSDAEGIVFNGIDHKTSMTKRKSGYPDSDYLKLVEKQLAAKLVTEEDLTDEQRDFMNNPRNVIRSPKEDFSSYFDTSHFSV